MSNSSTPTVGAPTSSSSTTAPSTVAQGIQQLIAALQAVVTAATTESAAPGASATQIAAAKVVIAQAQATIIDLQAQLVPAQSPTLYTVQMGDTLPGLAQQFLGDPLQFTALQSLNGLIGLALQTGQQLLIPSQSSP